MLRPRVQATDVRRRGGSLLGTWLPILSEIANLPGRGGDNNRGQRYRPPTTLRWSGGQRIASRCPICIALRLEMLSPLLPADQATSCRKSGRARVEPFYFLIDRVEEDRSYFGSDQLSMHGLFVSNTSLPGYPTYVSAARA